MANINDRKKDASQFPAERQGEIARTKAHATASMDELKAFISTMRGKNPQEIMGMVAGNSMTRAMIVSTIATILILAIGTIGPFLAYGHKDDRPDSKAAKAKIAAAKEAAAKEEAAKKEADEAAAGGDAKSADKGGSAKEKAVKSMTKEFDEVKGTKSNEAPSDVDDLLEKID